MDRAYWERVAEDYESEVFDVLEHDRGGSVLRKIDEFAVPGGTAADFGCGIGRFLPFLSSCFGEVLAVDVSRKCLAKAQAGCSSLDNVSYLRVDLAHSGARLPSVDFALSVNSVLSPSLPQRISMLDAVCGNVRTGGHLVLVVPALESALLSYARLIEWNLKSGLPPASATQVGFQDEGAGGATRLHEGVVPIDGVETKHYLREELEVLLHERGMTVLEQSKIEYPWDSEFTEPPRWMKAPFPWDWLCAAKRVR